MVSIISKMRTLVFSLALSIVLLSSFSDPSASARELTMRQPLLKSQAPTLPSPVDPSFRYQLVVKFMDNFKARSSHGDVVSMVSADMGNILQVTKKFNMTFSPFINLSENKLKRIEDRAATRSGNMQPDLAGMMIVHMQDESPGALEAAGQALYDLNEVEFVYIQTLGVPPPGDIAPTTPLLVNKQTYRAIDPGMNVDYAWSKGYKGAGIRLSDCEYGWIETHEDLNDINLHLEPGQTIQPGVYINKWDAHGAAVLGETSGVVNSYGVSGMVPDSIVYTYPEWTLEEGFRRPTAIARAIADSSPGDVVLLEMQILGYNSAYVPAEFELGIWLVVKVGTDAGVVVVAAAGNGNQDLDSADYATYMSWGDSGAIIVGAGSNTTSHDKLSFSTYGSRVNVQGWGTSVFTLGYGNFAQYGGDWDQSYTSTFSGTSSASPFIASAAVILQQAALDRTGTILTPLQLRDHLIQTGKPQGSGGNIGPFPDLEVAIDALGELMLPDIKANGSDGPISISQAVPLSVTVALSAGGSIGKDVDWWVLADTSFGWYRYNVGTDSWVPGQAVTYQGPVFDLATREILNRTGLPVGTYTLSFEIDTIMNGIKDTTIYADSVEVTVSGSSACGGWLWNRACWYTSLEVGLSCNQICASHGGFDVLGSQHLGNDVGKHFWPKKVDGANWESVECSSVGIRNNTNWGANGLKPDGDFRNFECYNNCACNN